MFISRQALQFVLVIFYLGFLLLTFLLILWFWFPFARNHHTFICKSNVSMFYVLPTAVYALNPARFRHCFLIRLQTHSEIFTFRDIKFANYSVHLEISNSNPLLPLESVRITTFVTITEYKLIYMQVLLKFYWWIYWTGKKDIFCFVCPPASVRHLPNSGK